MKKLLLKATIFCTFIAFTSCQKDELAENAANSEISIIEKKFEELSLDQQFQETFSKSLSKVKFESNTISKTALENQYGFTIADQAVKVIKTNGVTSYTMLIKRQNQNVSSFENLVLQTNPNNKSFASIIKYLPTEITPQNEHKTFAFKGTTIMTPLGYNKVNANSKSSGCIIIEITMCNYGGTEHIAGHNCTRTYKVTKSLCWNDDPVGGNNSGGGGSGNGGSGGYGGGGGGGGSYGDSGTLGSTGNAGDIANSENAPIVTSPVSPSLGSPEFILASQTGFFINSLPANLKTIVVSNPFAFQTIMHYVTDNGLNAQTKEIIKNALIKFEQIATNLNSPSASEEENAKMQEWALDYLLNNPNDNIKINNPIPLHSLNFNSLDELRNHIDNLPTFTSFATAQMPSQGNTWIGTYSFGITPLGGVKVNIKFNYNAQAPVKFAVSTVTTEQTGINFGDWNQSDYSQQTLANKNVKISIIGTLTYDYSIQGIGVKIVKGYRLIITIDTSNGAPIFSEWYHN
jgi:uncharacterized membrane protein YgcG